MRFEASHYPLWFSLSHSAPLGLDTIVQDMQSHAVDAALYTFFPDCSASGSSGESLPGWGPSISSSPVLAGPRFALGPVSLLDGPP